MAPKMKRARTPTVSNEIQCSRRREPCVAVKKKDLGTGLLILGTDVVIERCCSIGRRRFANYYPSEAFCTRWVPIAHVAHRARSSNDRKCSLFGIRRGIWRES